MTIGQSIRPLEWSFPLGPREPAIGYASRLAALNGEDLVSLMLGCGISYQKVHMGEDAAVRDVASLGGLDAVAAETLRRYSPWRQGPASGVGTQRLSWRALLTGHCRYCPRCVARDLVESPRDVPAAARSWLRIEWMVDQIRSCQVHNVRLFETERVTGFPAITDFSTYVAKDVLPKLERLCDEAEPAQPNAFEEWVLRRLDGDRDPDNWLDSMPLHAAVDACEAIARETLEKGGPAFSCLAAAEKAATSLAGYRIARGGEASIERFLDDLVLRGHKAGHFGSERIYGYLWRTVERTLDDPEVDVFRDIVRRHALENVPFPTGSLVLGHVLEKRRLHTAVSAAAESRTCPQTLRTIFQRAGMAHWFQEPDRRRLTIRVDEFEAKLKEYGAALNVRQICASTGILQRHALEFINRGILPALLGSQEVTKARHRVAVADVDDFMDRLFEGAVEVDTPNPRQVSLGLACRVATTTIGDLVCLILAGGLSWKGRLRGGMRYPDLLVDADEVMRVLQKDRPPRKGVSKEQIRGEMRGMPIHVVNNLIAVGQLVVDDDYCMATRRRLNLVTRDSFDAFKRRHVTMADLRLATRKKTRTVRGHFARLGIVPAFEPGLPGDAIYERSDALDAAMSTLSAGAPVEMS
jgi:hypothetical protein